MSAAPAERCGRIAVLGRANTGKSTLINALIGSNVHITTHRPQTTRSVTASQLTLGADQLVLVDTPGLHRRRPLQNRRMNKDALAEIDGSDLVLAVFDRHLNRRDDEYLVSRCQEFSPALALLNKVDLLRDKNRLLPRIAALTDSGAFQHVIPVSALQGDNLMPLREIMLEHLPAAAHQMAPNQVSDKPDIFFAEEIIRASLLVRYRQEVPHQIGIELEEFQRRRGRLEVKAVLEVQREGQKAILLGHGGERLGGLREEASSALAERFGIPVALRLHIRIDDD